MTPITKWRTIRFFIHALGHFTTFYIKNNRSKVSSHMRTITKRLIVRVSISTPGVMFFQKYRLQSS